DPMGATVIGNAKGPGVGDAAAAQFVRGLDYDETPAGGRQSPRSGDAGGTCSDDDRIHVAGPRHRIQGGRRRARRRERRRRRDGGGGGSEKGSTAPDCHGVRGRGGEGLAWKALAPRTRTFIRRAANACPLGHRAFSYPSLVSVPCIRHLRTLPLRGEGG